MWTFFRGFFALPDRGRVGIVGTEDGKSTAGFTISTAALKKTAPKGGSMKRKFAVLAVLLCAAFGLLAASGVVSSTKNPLQVALLHWYPANQVPTSFPAGGFTVGVAFDGASIWAANAGSNS